MTSLPSLHVFGAFGAFAAALGALAFLLLAAGTLARRKGPPAVPWSAALFGMAGWLGAIALAGPDSTPALGAETLRNLLWLWAMAAIAGRREEGYRVTSLGLVYMGLFTIQALLGGLLIALASGDAAGIPVRAFELGQMLVTAGMLVLLHNLAESGRPDERRALALPLGALAAAYVFDLNLYAISQLSGERAWIMLHLRPVAALAVAAALGIAALRPAGHAVRLSRPAALRSLALGAIALWLGLLAFAAWALRQFDGGDFAARAQIAIVAGMLAGAAILTLSPRLRASLRIWTVKHFFEYRYDYRGEWLRFTATLDQRGDGSPSLDARVIKALADIVESDGGILVAPDSAGRPALAAAWPSGMLPQPAGGDWSTIWEWVATSGRIVQFDEVRDAASGEEERAAVPQSLLDQPQLWIAVPLHHGDAMAGIVLLARPIVTRALDWEDFDLLRVAGRQAASHLAEARGAEALAESVRFEEFHRRFAFMMHDVKNLASQMGVLARNAERHGDNPAFRVDMIETLRLSADRLTQLMQRLSQQERVRIDRLQAVDIDAVVRRVACLKGEFHPIKASAATRAEARADADTVERILVHLVQNAIDASPPERPVRLAVRHPATSDAVEITITDEGPGMSPEFIRSSLFRPFSSTKDDGFGIGVYQARQLAEAMGGRLTVESRPGEGSRFTLSLPSITTETTHRGCGPASEAA